MQQLQDLIPYQYLIVAAVVLAALFIVTLVFRAVAGRSSEAGSSRLGVIEYLEIDKQRRLVLVRRDDVEHLMLIGGGHDLVVEAAIRPGVQRREEAPAAPHTLRNEPLEVERGQPAAVPRAHAAARPMPLRAARPAAIPNQAPAQAARPEQEPQGRAEPHLASLRAEDKTS